MEIWPVEHPAFTVSELQINRFDLPDTNGIIHSSPHWELFCDISIRGRLAVSIRLDGLGQGLVEEVAEMVLDLLQDFGLNPLREEQTVLHWLQVYSLRRTETGEMEIKTSACLCHRLRSTSSTLLWLSAAEKSGGKSQRGEKEEGLN